MFRIKLWRRVVFSILGTCNSILFGTCFVLDCEEGGVYIGGGDISVSTYGKRMVVLYFMVW